MLSEALGLCVLRAAWVSMSFNVLAFLLLFLLFLVALGPRPAKSSEVFTERKVHAICEQCWNERAAIAPYALIPVAVEDKPLRTEVCCLCAALTADGIYTQVDLEEMGCKHIRDIL
jgi:hypothetical protein